MALVGTRRKKAAKAAARKTAKPAKPAATEEAHSAARTAIRKGTQPSLPAAGFAPKTEIVRIEASEVVATLPEGTTATMSLPELIGRLQPRMPDSRSAMLSDGVKCLLPIGEGVAVVHQTPPQRYHFQWIRDDSEQEHGPGTTYRTVQLALPYVIVVAYFHEWLPSGGVPMLGRFNQCFFSNQPLEQQGLETPLAYPALLNCSKLDSDGSGMLSWICTQYLDVQEYAGRETLDASLRDGLRALLRHLFESGFNRSSEHHEGASGFGATIEAKVDPRLASVEAWQSASREDPLFVLEVPWLSADCTLGELVERFGRSRAGGSRRFDTAADLARLVVNGETGGQGDARRRRKAIRKKSSAAAGEASSDG